MSKLTDLINESIKNKFTDAADEEFRKMATEKLEATIKEEILSQEAETLHKKEERLRIIGEIDKADELFRTVIIIGTMVSVAAGLITDLLPFKQDEQILKFFIICLLYAVMYAIFYFIYLKKAKKQIEGFKEA